MKKVITAAMILALGVAGGAQDKGSFKLKAGTPAFQLAKDLAVKLPALDPEVNKVLVRTNGFEITTGEVIQALLDNAGKRSAQIKDLSAAQVSGIISKSAVQLGEKRLLLEAAAKAKISIPAGESDKTLKAEYDRAGGEKKFLDSLKSNGLSLEHVKQTLDERSLINAYLEKVFVPEIKVSPEEIEKAYAGDKTASVRHILLLTEGKNVQEKADLRKKMEEILAKAKAGADFAALAKQYSQDPGSKDNGGLYKDFERGVMVKPFEEAAFSVPVGQISTIVETSYGYHILQIVDRKKETRPLDAARPDIEKSLKQSKQEGAFIEFINKLKESVQFKAVDF